MSIDYYSLHNMPMGDDEDDVDDDYDDSDDMSETKVEEQGALSQIGQSFKSMLAGLICFIISWPVLYCGASRIHWDKVFKKAVPVEQAQEGLPVYVTGIPDADEIGDAYLARGKYLRISKSPEVYAWVEHTESKSKTERKGITRKKVTKTKTTYSYELEWTSNPKPISEFNSKYWRKFAQSKGISPNIINPTLAEKSETINSPRCAVNNYNIKVEAVSFYGGSQEKDKVYIRGTAASPRLGDKRVSYSVYPSDIKYTFAGAVSGKNIEPYYQTDEDSNLAAAPGDKNALIAALKQMERLKGILFFLGGFILMAAGLIMLAGPVTTLLDFIPFLGELGSGLIKFVLALVALILSAIFWWVVKLWWLILLVIVGLIVFKFVRKKQGQPAAA